MLKSISDTVLRLSAHDCPDVNSHDLLVIVTVTVACLVVASLLAVVFFCSLPGGEGQGSRVSLSHIGGRHATIPRSALAWKSPQLLTPVTSGWDRSRPLG